MTLGHTFLYLRFLRHKSQSLPRKCSLERQAKSNFFLFSLEVGLKAPNPKSNYNTTQNCVSQTSSFREKSLFQSFHFFSVSLIEFEISFPTRESFSLQQTLSPLLFLSQRKKPSVTPHFVVESERKIISIHAQKGNSNYVLLNAQLHTQNQQNNSKNPGEPYSLLEIWRLYEVIEVCWKD